MNTKGHSAKQGGLRGHSVGDLYPLMRVWVGTFENGKWCLIDARTNEVINDESTQESAAAINESVRHSFDH